MPSAAGIKLVTRQIEPSDRLTGLSCGDSAFVPLKIFLQRRALTYHIRHLARTYATFADGKVVGYITLVCGEVVVDETNRIAEPDLHYDYDRYPAVKIARLMVDSRYRRDYAIGSDLVQLALGTIKDLVCPAVGCRFAIVDSKLSSVGFYEKQGFSLIDTAENRKRSEPVMFIDLHKTPPK